MDNILGEIQTICISAAGAAATALILYLFNWLRTYLGIQKSDSNEEAIRRAATTEAGKLITEGNLMDQKAVTEAAIKIITDLAPQVKAEQYNSIDVKDMILGAAATFFPPAGLLKNFIK